MNLDQLICFYNEFAPDSVARFPEFYSADAYFKDPFNEVRGLVEIEAVFAHMFRTLDLPHFVVCDRIAHGQQAFLTWDFRFRFKGEDRWQSIHGATRLQFDAQGLVISHRDYWDAAEELYEKLPVLGALMRWLKRRVMRA